MKEVECEIVAICVFEREKVTSAGYLPQRIFTSARLSIIIDK